MRTASPAICHLVVALLSTAATSCAPLRGVVAGANRVQTFASPSPPERRVVQGIESACAAGSITWIVPVNGGVVLVDAGFDESGAQITRALRGRKVLAVLLTHGHLDHRSAAHLFKAPVYVGAGDLDLVRGERITHSVVGRLGDVIGTPPIPNALLPVDDGEVLVIGMRRFTVVALPGHTPGSVGWQYGRLLFTGDAVQGPLGDGELWPAPPTVTDDMRKAYASMRKLIALDVDTVLDGHFGRTDGVNAAAMRAVRRVHSDDQLLEHPVMRPAGCEETP
jgi:hydroxyacylglutathione hydrolase